jgi:hypothetical protein
MTIGSEHASGADARRSAASGEDVYEGWETHVSHLDRSMRLADA